MNSWSNNNSNNKHEQHCLNNDQDMNYLNYRRKENWRKKEKKTENFRISDLFLKSGQIETKNTDNTIVVEG
jgi:hypothetical protein